MKKVFFNHTRVFNYIYIYIYYLLRVCYYYCSMYNTIITIWDEYYPPSNLQHVSFQINPKNNDELRGELVDDTDVPRKISEFIVKKLFIYNNDPMEDDLPPITDVNVIMTLLKIFHGKRALTSSSMHYTYRTTARYNLNIANKYEVVGICE